MKKTMLLTMLIVSNFALAKTTYRIVNEHGDDPKVVVSTDPNYVHPDLKEVDPGYGQETLRLLEQKLRELSTLSMEDVAPAQLAIPDYTVAQNALVSKISECTVNYFLTLEDIQKKMKRVFSELLALHDEVVKENDPKGLMAQEYERDLKIKIPKLNTEVNQIYAKAIQDLFTLQGKANVPVKKKSSLYQNQMKQVMKIDFKQELMGICETRLCAMKLGSDLNAWFQFVQSFNRPLDFVKYNEAKQIWTPSTIKSSPFISMAIIDAADKMIGMKLEKNKEYSIGGIIAAQVKNTVETTAGVVVAIASAPVYVMEKLGIAMAKLLTLHYIHLELALNSSDTFAEKVIKDSFTMEVKSHADTLANSAIYVGEEDKKDLIEQTFLAAVERALYISPTFVGNLSDEQLVLVLTKIQNIHGVVFNLTRERIEAIRPKLSAEVALRVDQVLSRPIPDTEPGQQTDPSVSLSAFAQLLVNGLWLYEDLSHYRLGFEIVGNKLQAIFYGWGSGPQFKRPVKLMDNTAYVDYANNGSFDIKLTQGSGKNLYYSHMGGAVKQMHQYDTKNISSIMTNITAGTWLYENDIKYRIKFDIKNPKVAFFDGWGGTTTPFQRPMIVTSNKIMIDYDNDNTYRMVLTPGSGVNSMYYKYKEDSVKVMYKKTEY